MTSRLSCLIIAATMAWLSGCGGSGDTSGNNGKDVEVRDPTQRYAKTDISKVPLKSLQKCPSDTTFSFPVRYRGVEAAATCGSGTAVVKVGTTNLAIQHGWCEIDSDYVNYHFGTTTPAGTKRDNLPQYGPDGFGLSLGAQVHNAKPVDRDGTFVDRPSDKPDFGSTLVIENDRHMWSADHVDHDTTVVLSDGRSRGSVTATDFDGTPISVTFTCGNRIVGDAATEQGS